MECINSYGVATPRFACSGIAPCDVGGNTIDVPLNGSIVRISFEERKRILMEPLHKDVITCVLHDGVNNNIITTTFGGTCSIWTKDYKQQLATLETCSGSKWKVPILDASLSPDGTHICFVSFNRNRDKQVDANEVFKQATLKIYKIENSTFTHVLTKENFYDASFAWVSNDVLVGYINTTQPEYLFTTSANPKIFLLNKKGEVLKERELQGGIISTMTVNSEYKRVAFIQSKRLTTVTNFDLENIWHRKIPGYGDVFCANWKGDRLFVPCDRRYFYLCGPTEEDSTEFTMQKSIGRTYFFTWADSAKEIVFLFSPGGCHRVDLVKSKLETYQQHDLACCGVDINPMGTLVAAGDLSGLVKLWPAKSSEETTGDPFGTFALPGSVRSTRWRSDKQLLVGLMDGTVWVLELDKEPLKIFTMESTVTCLSFGKHKQDEPPSILAASDTASTLEVWTIDGDNYTRQCSLKGHGTEEIWSTAWSLDNRYLATGSEDRTIHIYDMMDMSKPILVETLKGMTAAVTCLDWKMTSLGSTLAASSDDRTVHVWTNEGSTFTLHHKFQTLHRHLMITYCVLTDTDCLVCVTMSGQMYSWNVSSKEHIAQNKPHIGSIEGISWCPKKKILATCSSDCTVNVYKHK